MSGEREKSEKVRPGTSFLWLTYLFSLWRYDDADKRLVSLHHLAHGMVSLPPHSLTHNLIRLGASINPGPILPRWVVAAPSRPGGGLGIPSTVVFRDHQGVDPFLVGPSSILYPAHP